MVGAALAAGITFFDTADIYGGTKSETFLGAALGPRRKRSCWPPSSGPLRGAPGGASPAYIRTALEDSLQPAGHRSHRSLSAARARTPKTPIAETLGTLVELVTEGKIREFGSSNSSMAPACPGRERSGRPARPGFVSVQNQYSVL